MYAWRLERKSVILDCESKVSQNAYTNGNRVNFIVANRKTHPSEKSKR